MSNVSAVKKAGAATPARVHSGTNPSNEEVTMNVQTTNREESRMNTASVTLTQAIVKASRSIRYPGPWAEYQGGPIDQFLINLMGQPGVPDTTAWGRIFWRTPIREALGAMPYLYRNASQQIIAQHFFGLLVDGHSSVEPERLIQELHDRFSMIRSTISGVIRADFDEFAEGTTPIQVAHQHAWQNEVDGTDNGAEGATVWASCSVGEVVGDFAEALTKGELNWATSMLIEQAGARLEGLDWAGWDKVALDLIPTSVEEEKWETTTDGTRRMTIVKVNKRQKAKDQLDSSRQRFWAVNKLYRQLIKTLWRMESLKGYWEYRAEQAAQEVGRPYGEAYAGGDVEMVEIGRISHVLADEGYDGTGHREGGPEREVLRLIEEELEDLQVMLAELAEVQAPLAPVWRTIGVDGVPVWYNRAGEAFTDLGEARAAYEMQREEWMRTRDIQAAQQMDNRVAKLLAEMANFDDIE